MWHFASNSCIPIYTGVGLCMFPLSTTMLQSRRIRGLTTILYKFNARKLPSSQPRSAHSLLSHVATLLTCSDQCDNEAKKVISVAGSVEPGLVVRILVVVQNAHVRSSAERIPLKVVENRHSSLDDAGNRVMSAQLRVDCNALTLQQPCESRPYVSHYRCAHCSISL